MSSDDDITHYAASSNGRKTAFLPSRPCRIMQKYAEVRKFKIGILENIEVLRM